MNAIRLSLLLFLICFLSTCSKSPRKIGNANSIERIFQSKDYSPLLKLKLVDRIHETPDSALQYFRELDHNSTYTSYSPSPEEIQLFEEYLKLLPPQSLQVMEERTAAIFFINNFMGYGMTNTITDKNQSTYTYLIFNPQVFKLNISEGLTQKVRTAFKKDAPHWNLEINAGKKYKTLLYILLHESTHVVDFIQKVSESNLPSTQNTIQEVFSQSPKIWQTYDEPHVKYAFNDRKRLKFYGLNNGPNFSQKRIPILYQHLESTPFPSLYGTANCQEDLAESITFYHLTQKLQQPYSISVTKEGKTIKTYHPLEKQQFKQRNLPLDQFY